MLKHGAEFAQLDVRVELGEVFKKYIIICLHVMGTKILQIPYVQF